MAVVIRGHFDGKVIVPDEPVDLVVGAPVEIRLDPENGERPGLSAARRVRRPGDEDWPLTDEEIQERRYWFRQSVGVVSAPPIPDEALRRENLYEERV